MEKQTDLFFNQILVKYKQRYIRFAQSYVHDTEAAEDLVMDSLLYYWENRENLSTVENVPMYLLTVIKHKCLNYLQRQCTWDDLSEKILSDKEWDLQMRISSLEACDPQSLFSEEIQQLFDKALETLPEKTRRIFMMSRSDEKSYKEIAETMNLTTKSIEFHMSKALGVLRIALKDYLPLLLPVFEFFYGRL
ncbi:RNA polymerase sigma-70 factor [Parabacteroides sp. Marseille-P3160]|uniref:RNA polymerase sigma-70 factor n=1 Tax=Parabacteroides sp. Marseille-P3160 TaxID=1917887 RepID=UPI0009B9FB79|nr:RNA polymerase sigma-70 factor [Parabacteroides sp. Marseille-P3160]